MVRKENNQNKPQRQEQCDSLSDLLNKIQEPYTSKDLVQLAKVMDVRIKDPTQIYPIDDNYDYLSKNMNGVHILFGGSGHGRKSSIYYANKDTQHPVLQIDANIYSTQNQFIQKLVTEFSKTVGIQNFGKKLVLSDQITYHNISKMIKENKVKIVIIIDNAEKLVQPKRQTILYTLLEWVKQPATKDHVVLFLVSKLVKFTDNLQKRVKSRMTANILYFHDTSIQHMIKLIQCRLVAAQVHYGLQQKIRQCLSYPLTFKKLLQHHQNAKSIQFFLNLIKCTICGLQPDQLRINAEQHFYQALQKATIWMSPNVGISLIVNSSCPEIIFMSIVSLLIKNQCSTLNLDVVLKEYVKLKQRLLDSSGIGSSFNYPDIVMERAFKRLIDMRILSIDDSLEAFRFAPIVLNINRQQMEKELLKLNKLPIFIKKILEQ